MSGKYRYVFKFGNGPKAHEILDPSIAYFWNDIYDLFDLYREMFVEKLNGTAFSLLEIKRLFNDLSEDMTEDSAEIWLEIQKKGMRLQFLEADTIFGFNLIEKQKLLEGYYTSLEIAQVVLSETKYEIVYYVEKQLIALLDKMEMSETILINVETVKILADKAKAVNAKNIAIVSWNEYTAEAKALAQELKIDLLSPDKMLQGINRKNLENAIDDFKISAVENADEKYTSERFRIYLELVKSARSNVAKKDSLEHLSKYFLNGVNGFKVIKTNSRGPSEEIDIILANESTEAPLNSWGNPIGVECRHRRKPASSKDIRDFYGKLASVGLKTGVLISLKGVTGDAYDAIGVIRDARKNGTIITVVTLEDLGHAMVGKTPLEIIRDCFYKYV